MKNILFLCHRMSYPPNKGDKIRSYNILKYLSSENNVSVGFLIDDANDLKYISTLEQQLENIFYDRIQTRVKNIQSATTAFIKGKPITVPYFYSSRLQTELDRFLDKHSIDTIICSSSPSAEYVFRSRHYRRLIQKVHLIMDFIDMDSQKWLQYAPTGKFPLSLIYRREARKLLEFEKRIEKEFDDLVIVSEAEKFLFRGIQNKVLETMAMGKAIVSTLQAAKGLNIKLLRDICIQREAKDFANAILELLSNKEQSKRFGRNARKVVERNYSWEQNLALLDTMVNQV